MNITRDAIAYQLTNDSAIIWWESDSTDTNNHSVEVNEFGGDIRIVRAQTTLLSDANNVEHAVHRVILSGLTPGSIFYFRILGPDYRATLLRSYITRSQNSDIRFALINNPEGYTGQLFPELAHTLDIIATEVGAVDCYLSCGGITNHWGRSSYEDWTSWYECVRAYLLDAGFISARGARDFGSVAETMFPVSLPERPYYAVNVGRLRIAVLDTSPQGRKGLAAGAPQRNWALNEFNSGSWKTAQYRMILGHDPFRVSLWDQSKSYGNGTGTDRFLFNNLYPLLQQSGADVAIFGRAHSYQRGGIESAYPQHEGQITHHIVSGGIAPAHTVAAWDWELSDPPGIIVSSSDYHYVTIDTNATALTLTCRSTQTSDIIDTFDVIPHTLY